MFSLKKDSVGNSSNILDFFFFFGDIFDKYLVEIAIKGSFCLFESAELDP